MWTPFYINCNNGYSLLENYSKSIRFNLLLALFNSYSIQSQRSLFAHPYYLHLPVAPSNSSRCAISLFGHSVHARCCKCDGHKQSCCHVSLAPNRSFRCRLTMKQYWLGLVAVRLCQKFADGYQSCCQQDLTGSSPSTAYLIHDQVWDYMHRQYWQL